MFNKIEISASFEDFEHIAIPQDMVNDGSGRQACTRSWKETYSDLKSKPSKALSQVRDYVDELDKQAFQESARPELVAEGNMPARRKLEMIKNNNMHMDGDRPSAWPDSRAHKIFLALAKDVCELCPLDSKSDCLDRSLKNNIEPGIWAGLTRKERSKLAQRNAR